VDSVHQYSPEISPDDTAFRRSGAEPPIESNRAVPPPRLCVTFDTIPRAIRVALAEKTLSLPRKRLDLEPQV
jgi:hypothetical protein